MSKQGGWVDNLQRAKAGKLSPDALQRLTWRAGGYDSCAVGEYREKLEARGYTFSARDGRPQDPDLDRLAHEFFGAVKDRMFLDAMDILYQIMALAEEGDHGMA